MPYLLQGGLGLPEREYYLSSTPQMTAIRTQYRAYIARLLTDAGMSDAEARAKRIYDLELRIATAHATRAQSEDFAGSATEWSQADFASKAPGIDWNAFFAGAGLTGQQRFVAYHAGAIPKLSALVAQEPLAAWQDWLVFHQINANADVLPTRLDQDHFAFYGTVLNGVTAQQTRDERGIEALNDALGDALGKLYVEQYFPASAKREIEGMVAAIKTAFERRIDALEWMAPETRAEAREKVRTIEVGVGYPDRWKDYSAFTVMPGAAYPNKIAAELVQYRQQLAKIGKPLDRREWCMNAQLVNAVNLPVQNALNFPAAYLQRPYFDPKADPAFNYGALGATIGHEISHSFDNNGAAFDAAGKLRNWWTSADLARFTREGKALTAQYNGYSPFPGVHVNGGLTLGENIADVAGLAAAYDAYRASLNGKEPPVIDGFTGDQRFFIAFSQGWATKQREESLRGRIATDGHAPGQYRALTVRNIDAWYKAFDVQPGDKLYLPPEKRVQIW
jgi:predicted metalloendopeptidase